MSKCHRREAGSFFLAVMHIDTLFFPVKCERLEWSLWRNNLWTFCWQSSKTTARVVCPV